ncbi:hypothetical protein [Aquamicrobium zhengzhouense]|uniref:Uncharacterized protein n=1 Tax=Aquamicrobium zhengzhouense TaxID=2781738 RepID=A0ABS0S9R2_9HYPH|nr:hypothetical protein [Aquamicrobium zhengzhouense]MBI1620031.1 hypothetical protein [Aquamicrobium zhengzhouense]
MREVKTPFLIKGRREVTDLEMIAREMRETEEFPPAEEDVDTLVNVSLPQALTPSK